MSLMSVVAMAVIQIGLNAGMYRRLLVIGWVIESGLGWPTAFWVLVPLSILGAVAGWMSQIR